MATDPMVTALQGPQPLSFDDRWGALNNSFDERWDALHPNEPNTPAYEPANINQAIPPGTGAFPPPWGGGGRITQQDPMAAMFAHPAQHLQHLAGDVLQGPAHWQAPRPPISPAQSGGAAGMWNLSRGDPYAVDTLGVHLTPDAKAAIEALAGPRR